MPGATYKELLTETAPARIQSDAEYDRIRQRFGTLLRQRHRTAAEDRLYDLLLVLIQDYDQRHALPPPDETPAERLRYLLEVSGKTPADLLPIFGQRSHVNEALNGKRSISVIQARKLGELFHLKPGYFL